MCARAVAGWGALVLGAASLGCGDDAGPTGELRVVHAAPEVGGVDVRVVDADGRTRATVDGLTYGDASPFLALAPGSYRVDVVPAGSGAGPSASLGPFPVAEGRALTAVVSEEALDGAGDDPTMFLVADDVLEPPPTPGRAALRLVQSAVGLPPVRVYVDGVAVAVGLGARAETLVEDLPATGFVLGVDLRDTAAADVTGEVSSLEEGVTTTGFFVRGAGDPPGGGALEVRLFARDRALGLVPLE